MSRQLEPPMNSRVYLHIPYKEKETAKEFGCRWDPIRKQWYCIDDDKNNVSKCVKVWNYPEPYKIINNEIIFLSNIPINNRGFST